jgi:DnaJ homolog subfamily C member 19
MATAIIVGTGVTIAALAGRAALNAFKQSGIGLSSSLPGTSKFLRGGFEPVMSYREACQILGVKENASPDIIKKAHRAVMLPNHPDRGGSPFIASKINEAKEMLDKKRF